MITRMSAQFQDVGNANEYDTFEPKVVNGPWDTDKNIISFQINTYTSGGRDGSSTTNYLDLTLTVEQLEQIKVAIDTFLKDRDFAAVGSQLG